MLRGFEYGLLVFFVSAILLWYRQHILIVDEIVSLGRFMFGIALGVVLPAYALMFAHKTLINHLRSH